MDAVLCSRLITSVKLQRPHSSQALPLEPTIPHAAGPTACLKPHSLSSLPSLPPLYKNSSYHVRILA